MNKPADSKLALGTAQFGLDYGVNNKKGKLSKKEVFRILNFALENNIHVLDTAYVYGDSERIIGEFIKKNNARFSVISKLPSCDIDDIDRIFDNSLKRLNLQKIYGYLVHNFKAHTKQARLWDTLERLKTQGKVEKTGFSLYYPKEAEHLLKENIQVDIIQAPFSILDQRFSGILPLLEERGIEVHIRSIFLQGLIFQKPDQLKANFTKLVNKLSFLRTISQEMNIPLSAIFTNFAVLNKCVKKVIIGADDISHLQEAVNALRYKTEIENIYDKLAGLKEEDESIILPVNWPKEKRDI